MLTRTICVAAIGLLATGCSLFEGKPRNASGQAPSASPRQHPVLANIPLPMGFQIDPKNSNAWESGKVRFANCQFEGPGSIDDIAEFYAQYMPAAKFTLQRKRFEAGQWVMNFESDTEECTVHVKPKGNRAIIVIELGPFSRIAGEKSEPKPTKPQPTLP